MGYTILQLSDLHIGAKFKYSGKEWGEIVGNNIRRGNGKIIRKIIMTGDIFDWRKEMTEKGSDIAGDISEPLDTESNGGNVKGSGDEKLITDLVSKAVDFFDVLLEKINDAQNNNYNRVVLSREDILLVPGNHDVCTGEGEEKPWALYNLFMNTFYGGNIPDCYDMNDHMVRYTDEKHKIQFLGFNSCSARNEEINVDNPYINGSQIEKADREARMEGNADCYRIAFFHHPNYLFQEMSTDENRGIQVNSRSFMEELAGWNVKAAIHGHKHTFRSHISRPRIGQKMYVIACGSIGMMEIDQRSCNLIDIEGDDESRELHLHVLEANNEAKFEWEEKNLEDNYAKGMLCENLARENNGYQEEKGSDVDNIVKLVNELYVNGDSLSILLGNPDYFHLMVEGIRFRLDSWNRHGATHLLAGEEQYHLDVENRFKEAVGRILGQGHEELKALLDDVNFLFSRRLKQEMERDRKLKKSVAYLLLAAMFTDLYNTFGKGQLQLRSGGDAQNAGNGTGRISFRKGGGVKYDISFGYIQVRLVCHDVETEKAAASAVYEIRNRYNVVWGCLSCIGIHVRNIIPEIENLGMNGLGWYEMDASIPQMIRLLTGKNIYESDCVFARELVQNAIDAISFREKLEQSSEKWKKDIQVEFGNDPDGRYYFKIADHGIGMGREIIEHYFTTLGKSYYKENGDGESIKYNSISNFGIGFLSVFRPCEEIVIQTKHFMEKTYYKLQIRDDQDYFLVDTREDEEFDVGMEITCYLKEGNQDFIENLFLYLKERMLDIKYNICVNWAGMNPGEKIPGGASGKNAYPYRDSIESRAIRRVKGNKIFICFDEDSGVVREIDDMDEILKGGFVEKYRHGMLIQMDARADSLVEPGMVAVLNAGVLMENASVEDIFGRREPVEPLKHIGVVMNFPPKWLEIDVSRDKVIGFRSMRSNHTGDNQSDNTEEGGGLEEFKSETYECFCNQLGSLIENENCTGTSLAAVAEAMRFMGIFRPKACDSEVQPGADQIASGESNLTLTVDFKITGDENKIDFSLRGTKNLKDDFLREGTWNLGIQYTGDSTEKGRALHNSLISLFSEVCEGDAAHELIRAENSPKGDGAVAGILKQIGISWKQKSEKYLPLALSACLRGESAGTELRNSEMERTANILINRTLLRECTLGDIGKRKKKRILSIRWKADESARMDMESDPLEEMIRRVADDKTGDAYGYIWDKIFLEAYESYYEPDAGIWAAIRRKGQDGYLAAKNKIKGLYASNSDKALIDVYLIAGCYADALLRIPKELSAQMVKRPDKPDDTRYRWVLDSCTKFVYVWKKSEYIREEEEKPECTDEGNPRLEKWIGLGGLIWPARQNMYERSLKLLSQSDVYIDKLDIMGFAEQLRWLALYNEELLKTL